MYSQTELTSLCLTPTVIGLDIAYKQTNSFQAKDRIFAQLSASCLVERRHEYHLHTYYYLAGLCFTHTEAWMNHPDFFRQKDLIVTERFALFKTMLQLILYTQKCITESNQGYFLGHFDFTNHINATIRHLHANRLRFFASKPILRAERDVLKFMMYLIYPYLPFKHLHFTQSASAAIIRENLGNQLIPNFLNAKQTEMVSTIAGGTPEPINMILADYERCFRERLELPRYPLSMQISENNSSPATRAAPPAYTATEGPAPEPEPEPASPPPAYQS